MKRPLFYAMTLLSATSLAQNPSFPVGTNIVQVIYEDASASPQSKALFFSDLSKEIVASENGLSIMVTTNEWHPSFVSPAGQSVSTFLHGLAYSKFTNGTTGFPTTLVCTNGIWTLNVSKHYTDAYSNLCEFASAHSNEIAKLRAFVSNDLDATRLASLSDDDIYEMYLSKQWEPGDRGGPSLLPAQDRPQILRGTYYQPPVAAVLSWPMGPSDAAEHLWAQINVRVEGRIYETRAIYFRDKWWLTIWDWEEGDPVWSP